MLILVISDKNQIIDPIVYPKITIKYSFSPYFWTIGRTDLVA